MLMGVSKRGTRCSASSREKPAVASSGVGSKRGIVASGMQPVGEQAGEVVCAWPVQNLCKTMVATVWATEGADPFLNSWTGLVWAGTNADHFASRSSDWQTYEHWSDLFFEAVPYCALYFRINLCQKKKNKRYRQLEKAI